MSLPLLRRSTSASPSFVGIPAGEQGDVAREAVELRRRGWRPVDLLPCGQVEAAWEEMERPAELAHRLTDPLHPGGVTAWQARRAALAGRFEEEEAHFEAALEHHGSALRRSSR